MSKRNTLIAFVAGAAAGALAGILLAPAKGKQTREKLASQMGNLSHEVSHQIKSGSTQVRKLADRAAEQVNHVGRKVKVS